MPPGPDPRGDQALLAALVAGETEAFEVLYWRYRDWVLRVAYRHTQDRDEALDVLQETFAYLHRRAATLRLEARLTTFLYPVVKHTAEALRRKRRRLRTGEAGVEEPAAPEPPPPLEDLHVALGGLDPRHREVLILRHVDGLSLEEIARVMGIPLGTVKSRLHSALAALRRDPRTRRHFLN